MTQQPDSKTVDVMRLGGRRERVTVRIKPELKKALSEFCKTNGLSICHISEALYSAYLVGVNQKINLDIKRPTIELTVVRDVKRVRRYAKDEGGGGGRDVFIEDIGDETHCAVCEELPTFEAFSWTDRYHCVRTWLCNAHFDKKLWSQEGKGWCRLGGEPY